MSRPLRFTAARQKHHVGVGLEEFGWPHRAFAGSDHGRKPSSSTRSPTTFLPDNELVVPALKAETTLKIHRVNISGPGPSGGERAGRPIAGPELLE
jgi:hypothetical protein